MPVSVNRGFKMPSWYDMTSINSSDSESSSFDNSNHFYSSLGSISTPWMSQHHRMKKASSQLLSKVCFLTYPFRLFNSCYICYPGFPPVKNVMTLMIPCVSLLKSFLVLEWCFFDMGDSFMVYIISCFWTFRTKILMFAPYLWKSLVYNCGHKT